MGKFLEYNPLITSRENILLDYANSKFKEEGVKIPKQLKEKPGEDKNMYSRFPQTNAHNAEYCIQLKDVTEYLT